MSDEIPHGPASDLPPATVPLEAPAARARPSLAARQPILEWVAILLGALSFVWGFLDWYGSSSGSQNGYRLLDGYPPIGFALLAALFAAVNLSRSRSEHLAWLSIGASLIAVVFTIVAMSVKPTFLTLFELLSSVGGETRVHLSVQYGLILTLVTTILQLLCLIGGWLLASGRLAVPGGGPGLQPGLEAPAMPMPGPSVPPTAPGTPSAANAPEAGNVPGGTSGSAGPGGPGAPGAPGGSGVPGRVWAPPPAPPTPPAPPPVRPPVQPAPPAQEPPTREGPSGGL